jgi:splicing factor, arginine/serine-rich 4/5/6
MGKVFIGNLTDRAEGRDVEDAFRKFGRIKEISLKNGFGQLFSAIIFITVF